MKTKIVLLTFILCYLSISSCSDSDKIAPLKPASDPGVKNLLDADPDLNNIIICNFENFSNKDDVFIVNEDTTLISISTSFIEKQNRDILRGNILAIVLSEVDQAFVRKVVSADNQGDRILVGTEYASMEEMFKSLDIELSSEPYYNEQAAATRSDVSYAGYLDNNKVLHPTRIVLRSEEGDTKVIYPAKTNDISKAEIDLYYSWDMEDDFHFSNEAQNFAADINGFKGNIYAGTNVSINISWFKLKRFYARFYGGAHFDVPFYFTTLDNLHITHQIDTDIPSGKKKWKGISATFMVGLVPISIGVQPTLNYVHDISINGEAEIDWGFNYDMDFDMAVEYLSESGWREIRSCDQNFKFKDFRARTDVSANIDAALYAKLYLTLYGWRTVYTKLGGYINGIGNVNAYINNSVTDSVAINLNSYWGLRGGIGTNLKIGKIQLYRWDNTFNITGPHKLYDLNYVWHPDSIISNQIEDLW